MKCWRQSGTRCLVRLPWSDWFPDTSMDHITKALRLQPELRPAEKQGTVISPQVVNDRKPTVGPDLRLTVLMLLTCSLAFMSAVGYSPGLATVTRISSGGAIALILSFHALATVLIKWGERS